MVTPSVPPPPTNTFCRGVYPVGVLHNYMFIISQLWLSPHLRSTVVLLDNTPGASREIYSEDAYDGTLRLLPSNSL